MKFCPVVIAVVLAGSFSIRALAHDMAESEPGDSKSGSLRATTHVVHNDDPWHLLEMALTPVYAATTNVQMTFDGVYRIIRSNGIPNHATGEFPNPGNPNTISEQTYLFRMLKDPKYADRITSLSLAPFGVAVNGIPFDPGANEFWNRDRTSGWQYEPMYSHSLGLDDNNAHVQPNGAYHYHGLPTGLLNRLASSPKPVLIGYAADGFPIYAPFGYRDPKNPRSGMVKLRSSYRLKGGTRPSGPGGSHDGEFVEDYEYVANAGDLDECNGRYGVTSEYPNGIYHYYVTDTFPFISRKWRGTPDETFLRHGHIGGRRNGPNGGGGFGSGPGFGPDGGGPPGGGPGGSGPGGGPDFGPDGGGPPGGGPGGGPGFGPRGGPGGSGPGGGGPGFGPRGGPGGGLPGSND